MAGRAWSENALGKELCLGAVYHRVSEWVPAKCALNSQLGSAKNGATQLRSLSRANCTTAGVRYQAKTELQRPECGLHHSHDDKCCKRIRGLRSVAVIPAQTFPESNKEHKSAADTSSCRCFEDSTVSWRAGSCNTQLGLRAICRQHPSPGTQTSTSYSFGMAWSSLVCCFQATFPEGHNPF